MCAAVVRCSPIADIATFYSITSSARSTLLSLMAITVRSQRRVNDGTLGCC